MILNRKLRARLDSVGILEGGAPASELEIEHDGGALTLRVSGHGPVGTSLEELRFRAPGAVAGSNSGSGSNSEAVLGLEELWGWADRFAGRVTYLGERLKVEERDGEGGEARLRSERPSAWRGRRSYFEANLRRDGTLRLRRVEFDECDWRRRPSSSSFTSETLERLVEDLWATSPRV